MNMNMLSVVITILGTLCAIGFGYREYLKNHANENKEEAHHDATILTEIGYIKANTEEIKQEQKEQRAMNLDMITRLVANEENIKQAHKLIDELKR